MLASLLLSSFLLTMIGCAPRPLIKGEKPPVPSSEGAERIRERSEHWKAYQAKLQIRTESAKGKYSFRGVALGKLPNQLRVEVTNLWGQTMGILVSNQDKSSLWIASDNILYTADDAGKLIEYLFGFPIPAEILGYSLIGCVPPGQVNEQWQMHYNGFQWIGYTSTFQQNWRLTWKFLPETIALKFIHIIGSPWNYNIVYEPAVEGELQSLPETITYSSPSSEWQMQITISQATNLIDDHPSLFDPVFPSSAREIHLGELK